MIEFAVPGKPVPKGRPRVMKGGWTFTPKKTLIQENAVRLVATARRQAAKVSISAASFRLQVICYGAHPLADWDNLGKLVSDALNGIFWEDDRQVIDAHVMKLPCRKGDEQTLVRIEAL